MKTYKCGKCNKILKIINFHKSTCTKGHNSICKHCRNASPRRVWHQMLTNAKKRAKKRNLEFDLTPTFLKELNRGQNGVCAYTGIKLNWDPKNSTGIQRVCPPDRASLDRKDPALGYIKSNVHLVVDFVNRIKCWYPERDFIGFCKKVLSTAQ